MVPYQALYGRKCRTPLSWVEVGERQLLCPQLVYQATEKVRLIRDILKEAQDRQQKYYDSKHKIVEFDRVRQVAYKLALTSDMFKIHNDFHISMLIKWVTDESQRIPQNDIKLQKDLTYVEEPEKILKMDVHKLRNRMIPFVKVKWKHRSIKQTTWEKEADMIRSFLTHSKSMKSEFRGRNSIKEGRFVKPKYFSELFILTIK
ncbi:hypothetical protein MA16_Dca023436 [Dendrobium catenatum]|uniref:Chromo domain-containing protein n=1 Tax=Dendrobium catenatum TaxID=906689 RepID=A0A2I0WYJ8_9ASPA|nr:hypothetical protein MA16_Dca023436 [Dendrobium catenatum]